jgi:hypothetical protein
MSGNTVSAELAVVLVTEDQTMTRLVAGFRYCRRDPFAVRIAFRGGAGEPVEWFCARELLRAGLEGRAGSGDVIVWPSSAADGGGVMLHIELSSPYGEAHFQTPAWGIGEFLCRTYELVTAGQESRQLDIDAELDDLLGRAA